IYSKQDSASFSAGASIIEDSTTPTWIYHREIHPFKFPSIIIPRSHSHTVLASDLSIGTCWPFHKTTGKIGIQLGRTIWIQGLTIGHVFPSLAYDIRTAPKEFELWGLSHYSPGAEKDLLLQGTYRVNGLNNVQEFSVPTTKMQLYSRVL
ncbi:hypothetical protein PSTT_03532, partial [Puccinia striiformis]